MIERVSDVSVTFYSLLGVSSASVSTILEKLAKITFYSLLGVSDYFHTVYLATKEFALSTPFWEFPVDRSVLSSKLSGRQKLSTPFWEFLKYLKMSLNSLNTGEHFLLPFGSFYGYCLATRH